MHMSQRHDLLNQQGPQAQHRAACGLLFISNVGVLVCLPQLQHCCSAAGSSICFWCDFVQHESYSRAVQLRSLVQARPAWAAVR